MSKTRNETFKAPSADDPVLSEIVRRLSEVYHPLRIYLFGSAARGDACPTIRRQICREADGDTGLFVTLESRRTFLSPPLGTSKCSCI